MVSVIDLIKFNINDLYAVGGITCDHGGIKPDINNDIERIHFSGGEIGISMPFNFKSVSRHMGFIGSNIPSRSQTFLGTLSSTVKPSGEMSICFSAPRIVDEMQKLSTNKI